MVCESNKRTEMAMNAEKRRRMASVRPEIMAIVCLNFEEEQQQQQKVQTQRGDCGGKHNMVKIREDGVILLSSGPYPTE